MILNRKCKIVNYDFQEQFEESSGNILLTLRSITQKPLQFFLDWENFTKVSREGRVTGWATMPCVQLSWRLNPTDNY